MTEKYWAIVEVGCCLVHSLVWGKVVQKVVVAKHYVVEFLGLSEGVVGTEIQSD